MTPLDHAHQAMNDAPENDAARLRFYERLADAELILLLEDEPAGGTVRPRIFPVEGQDFALVFDREDRLTEFVGGTAPYAALSGRALCEILAPEGIGLGVNLGVAPSSILIEAASVAWLSRTLGQGPEEVEERPETIAAPAGLPEPLLRALDAKLASAEGRARMAYLVGVGYGGGRKSHLLGFVDPVAGAEGALARAVGEALTFSGVEAGTLDVGFFRSSDPICAKMARVGLRFDLPQPAETQKAPGAAPGMDPSRPPKLR